MPEAHVIVRTSTVGFYYDEPATGWHWATVAGPEMRCRDCGRPFTHGYSAVTPGTYEPVYFCGCTVRAEYGTQESRE